MVPPLLSFLFHPVKLISHYIASIKVNLNFVSALHIFSYTFQLKEMRTKYLKQIHFLGVKNLFPTIYVLFNRLCLEIFWFLIDWFYFSEYKMNRNLGKLTASEQIKTRKRNSSIKTSKLRMVWFKKLAETSNRQIAGWCQYVLATYRNVLQIVLHQCDMLLAITVLCLARKEWSFPSMISSVNVTKSVVSCGFDHIYLRNP